MPRRRLPLGRLRARGGLSRIEGEDLCFDVPETDRLFREAYHRPLEPDIVAELIKRTEGWAALLTLVRTSLEDKDAPEARALVAQLSATRGDLYDFLAEEVLETLSPSQQRFLTRVSVLVSVDAETGSLVDGRPPPSWRRLIAEAETLGLLTRPDRESPHRFHPLVRDFLVARLREEVGDAPRPRDARAAWPRPSSRRIGSAPRGTTVQPANPTTPPACSTPPYHRSSPRHPRVGRPIPRRHRGRLTGQRPCFSGRGLN